MTDLIARRWAALETHFHYHARMVARFRHAEGAAVVSMWQSQSNESGNPLTPFERHALVERHCELFGAWPEGAQTGGILPQASGK